MPLNYCLKPMDNITLGIASPYKNNDFGSDEMGIFAPLLCGDF